MRKLTRRVAMAVAAVVPAAVVIAFSGSAEAVTCALCSSDRRLKKNIQPI